MQEDWPGTRLLPLSPSAGSASRFFIIGLGYGTGFLLLFEAAQILDAYFSVSLWYPAAGLRLAALLWFGWRFGFIAFVAELIVYELCGFTDVWLQPENGIVPVGRVAGFLAASALPILCYALAATAAARVPLAPTYRHGLAYVTRLCGAGALAALLAALSTCHVIAASGLIAADELPRAVAAFWVGDVVGILTWAPILGLGLRRAMANRPALLPNAPAIAPPLAALQGNAPPASVVVESLLVCVIAALLMHTNARADGAISWYPLTLPIIWSAFRWGLGGAIIAGLGVTLAIAAMAAIAGIGEPRSVQIFMVVMSLSGLLLGAFSSALREERASLEHRVRVRTRALADEIERRRRAETLALAEKQRAELYLDMTQAAIVACDRDGVVTRVNAEACAILGRDRRALEGATVIGGLIPPDHRPGVTLAIDELLNGTAVSKTFATSMRRRDGVRVFVEWRAVPLHGDDGTVSGVLLAGIDLTERAHGEEQVRFLATHDALTGVYNRHVLPEIVADALARARRTGSGVAVLFADLNGFKRINDTWGHGSGDQILIETARRLTARIRETDRVIRIGGDEFVVVLEQIAEPRTAARIALDLARVISRPIALKVATVRVGVAIGIACHPLHGDTPADLLTAADRAMYVRKQRRGSGIRLAGCAPAQSAPDPR